MDIANTFRAIFSLILVLGLILGLAYVMRRFAPQWLAKLSAARGKRRLEVLETLVLDPARRLIIVRIDNDERLILLGDGKDLGGHTVFTQDVFHSETKPITKTEKKPTLTEVPKPDPTEDLFTAKDRVG
jgi:flagellar protein FliO/FliZ